MDSAHFHLDFKGYWLHPPKNREAAAGIFCVYTCLPSPEQGKLRIGRLLYIGEGENVWKLIESEEESRAWGREAKGQEKICFSFAATEETGRRRIEAALIHEHRPPCNADPGDRFGFAKTTVSVEGRSTRLTPRFTVPPEAAQPEL